MNKKIYLNDKYIEIADGPMQFPVDQEIKQYPDFNMSETSLRELANEFTGTNNNYSIVIAADFKKFVGSFKSRFYYIEAAGGFIENGGKFLFIHRHGRWDLPKGKLEKKETIETAAIRECEEECGIQNLEIKKALSSTFHIYPYKKGYALKQTFWFYMTTDFSGRLVPQTEEDIDQVKWFGITEINSTVLEDTYYTISDVVKEALDL